MNNPIFTFSLYQKTLFPQVNLRILFFLLFCKSQVQASSEVQTQTDCLMYAILLPVISITDLTSLTTQWSN